MGVTPKQIREIAESQWRQLLETYADNILPVSQPDHKRVYEITNKLIMANTDEITGQHMNWEVNVVESNEINAFVLPVSCRVTVFIIRKYFQFYMRQGVAFSCQVALSTPGVQLITPPSLPFTISTDS